MVLMYFHWAPGWISCITDGQEQRGYGNECENSNGPVIGVVGFILRACMQYR